MATTNKKLDPTNENLVLPDYNEKADINVINSNFTKAADAVNTLNSKLTTQLKYSANDNVFIYVSGNTVFFKVVARQFPNGNTESLIPSDYRPITSIAINGIININDGNGIRNGTYDISTNGNVIAYYFDGNGIRQAAPTGSICYITAMWLI